MDDQSTKINDLPGGKIEDDELFDPTFYSENERVGDQFIYPQEEMVVPSVPVKISSKKEKSFFEEDFVLLMILLYIRTLPIINNLTQEIPFVGNYIRNNVLLTTIISSGILALLYIISKKYLN